MFLTIARHAFTPIRVTSNGWWRRFKLFHFSTSDALSSLYLRYLWMRSTTVREVLIKNRFFCFVDFLWSFFFFFLLLTFHYSWLSNLPCFALLSALDWGKTLRLCLIIPIRHLQCEVTINNISIACTYCWVLKMAFIAWPCMSHFGCVEVLVRLA